LAEAHIAIVGAGIGGLATAATLAGAGFSVDVYEQAKAFARVGAGIQMMPNSMKVLRGLSLEAHLKRIAFAPKSHLNREWDSGEVTNELPMPVERYGAPYLCMHRAELHAALLSAVPRERVHLGKKLVDFEGGQLHFEDGSVARADAVVGADGVHSVLRELLLGKERPIHRGRVAYRAVFPASRLPRDIGPSRTKWWGPNRHIVIYYTTAARDEVYFVTSNPEPVDWVTEESWSATGDVDELRSAFDGFHADVRMVLDATPSCHKWAILERAPLPTWSIANVVLIGDAAHPMTPYMAQGGATAIEDAAVLARCLSASTDCGAAFRMFEAHRKPRTSRIQAISSANTWLRTPDSNPDWLYGYDAWTAPLDVPASVAT
jgi:2-polyprenyl-6-methoxyphenol hydroxylase-like FAD-dependent oxidoreductase